VEIVLREMLQDCQKGFAEVVLMMANSITTAEIYTTFDDLRFSNNQEIVTFMGDGGTHVHLELDQVTEARFLFTMNQQGLPSYSLWLMGEGHCPVLRVYLRKSEKEETNQPRHDLFMALREKYGELVRLHP
jgi:putative heme iron utilization protein